MTFEIDFEELMVDTVTIQPYSRLGMGGVPVWSTAAQRTYRARWVERPTLFQTGQTNELVQTGLVYMGRCTTDETLSSAGPRDRVQLNGSTVIRDVIGIDRYPDEDGSHHQRIRLG